MTTTTHIGLTRHQHDAAYLEAHALATALLKAGEIRAYSVSRHRDLGRVIEVETDQGWDPAPLFCEHPAPDNPMRYL
jgi:hypothetical protein